MFRTAPRVAVVREARLRPVVSLLNNQQRRYRFRLRVVSRLYPTMNTLPITLPKGKDQAKPEEIVNGDDNSFMPIGRGRETLGQRLGRTVVEGTGIDTSAGTDHTKWVETETFPGSIAPFTGNQVEGEI